jgi:hypothetical protein
MHKTGLAAMIHRLLGCLGAYSGFSVTALMPVMIPGSPAPPIASSRGLATSRAQGKWARPR